MDEWSVLRVAIIVVAWLAVAGGVTLAAIWFGAGGARAFGPNERLMEESGAPPEPPPRRATSFSIAQLLAHGFFGVATAALATYGALRADGRTGGCGAVIVVAAIAAVPGLLMYQKWRAGHRPDSATASTGGRRPEDRFPRPIVYAHGLAAAAVVALALVLFIVD